MTQCNEELRGVIYTCVYLFTQQPIILLIKQHSSFSLRDRNHFLLASCVGFFGGVTLTLSCSCVYDPSICALPTPKLSSWNQIHRGWWWAAGCFRENGMETWEPCHQKRETHPVCITETKASHPVCWSLELNTASRNCAEYVTIVQRHLSLVVLVTSALWE